MKNKNMQNKKKSSLGVAPATARKKQTNAPIASNRSSSRQGGTSFRVRECERVGTVSGSINFGLSGTFQTNPGLALSFPWLSGIGVLFEKYRVNRLVYRYKNLKGTSSDGNVIMSYDYDSIDAAPASSILATQSTVYVDGAPWRTFEMKVPTDGRKLFTRGGSAPGDPKTYDMGALHVTTEACADTSIHGYLEVDYDIEFFDKQPSVGGAATGMVGSCAEFVLTAPQLITVDKNIEFDTTLSNNTGATIDSGGLISMIPAGTWCVSSTVGKTGSAGEVTSLEFVAEDETGTLLRLDPLLNTTTGTSASSNVNTGGWLGEMIFSSLVPWTLRMFVNWVSGTLSLPPSLTNLILTRIA